jgi:hypothetical protein
MWKDYRYGRAMLISISLALLTASSALAAGSLAMKACELLTRKDVEGVLGSGYTPQEMLNNQIMSACAYTKGKVDVVSVTLKQEFYGAAQVLKMEQEGIKQQGGAITPVNGLGEGAYYLLDSKNNIFQLNFGKGKLRVIVTVNSGGKPNIEAALKLAKIVYPRLK